jgi:hypothetical protein
MLPIYHGTKIRGMTPASDRRAIHDRTYDQAARVPAVAASLGGLIGSLT